MAARENKILTAALRQELIARDADQRDVILIMLLLYESHQITFTDGQEYLDQDLDQFILGGTQNYFDFLTKLTEHGVRFPGRFPKSVYELLKAVVKQLYQPDN